MHVKSNALADMLIQWASVDYSSYSDRSVSTLTISLVTEELLELPLVS